MNNLLFSKNKNELITKINTLIDILNEDSLHKACLLKWKQWFIKHENEIVLPELPSDKFYRAYFNNEMDIDNPVFGIQLWKMSKNQDNVIVCDFNLYSSDIDRFDNKYTQHLS